MTVRSLLEQADRAERLARSVLDTFASEALMGYARECRDKAAAPSCGPFSARPNLVHDTCARAAVKDDCSEVEFLDSRREADDGLSRPVNGVR
jgi:hypothetical protein